MGSATLHLTIRIEWRFAQILVFPVRVREERRRQEQLSGEMKAILKILCGLDWLLKAAAHVLSTSPPQL